MVFNKNRGYEKFLVLFFLFVMLIGFASYVSAIEVNSLILKSSIKEGDSLEKRISLIGDTDGYVNLEVVDINGVGLSEDYFYLLSGESKTVQVSFNASGVSPGVHIGRIKITQDKDISYLPVIFEVESRDVFFDANLDIPPQYTSIEPGGKLLAQLRIFDLTSGGTSQGLGSTKIDIEYIVLGVDSGIISSEAETIVVDKQTQITKSLSFPKDIKEGDYVFSVILRYKSSVGVSSSVFSITKPNQNIFSGASDAVKQSFILILVGIIVISVIFILIFFYFVRGRDKMIDELRKCNESELKKQREFLLEQERQLIKRGFQRNYVKKEIDNKVKQLKKKHIHRENELKKLRDKGDMKQMENKISEWKDKGYNTLSLEYKLKGMKAKDMNSLMSEWKKKYNRRV